MVLFTPIIQVLSVSPLEIVKASLAQREEVCDMSSGSEFV